jgi:hypothetical protein
MEYGETFEEMMERTEAESRAREASEGGRGAARGRGNISKRFSVVMQTVEGGSPAEFTMCDRSKNSVVLRNTIECFADYEPPWDSDQTTQLFEDALVNLTRDEGEGRVDAVSTFRKRFSAGPRVRNTRSRYLIVGDDPGDATLIHLVDVDLDAPLERVKAVVRDRAESDRWLKGYSENSFPPSNRTRSPRFPGTGRFDGSSRVPDARREREIPQKCVPERSRV